MVTNISEGVKVGVETFYQPEYSNPAVGECMFAYKIHLENRNDFSLQLLSRHWYIFDSIGSTREVEGDGVIGIQPIIKPGESYSYTSGCNLYSEIGSMHGTYTCVNLLTEKSFTILIPLFELVAPFKLN